MFLLGRDVYLGKLPEFHEECEIPFRVPRGNVRYLWKHCSVKGPNLAWRGYFHGFSRDVVGSLGFLSLRGDLGDMLVFPQGSQISFGVTRGTSGFLLRCCRDEQGLISS